MMWKGSLHVFHSLICEEDERDSHSCNWLLLYVAFLTGRIIFNGWPHLMQFNFMWNVFYISLFILEFILQNS